MNYVLYFIQIYRSWQRFLVAHLLEYVNSKPRICNLYFGFLLKIPIPGLFTSFHLSRPWKNPRQALGAWFSLGSFSNLFKTHGQWFGYDFTLENYSKNYILYFYLMVWIKKIKILLYPNYFRKHHKMLCLCSRIKFPYLILE